MPNRYLHKKVLVIGLGLSGRAACQFLLNEGATVIGVDSRAQEIVNLTEIQDLQTNGLEIKDDQFPIDFKTIDLVILSPGIPVTHPLVEKAKQCNKEIIGEIELGCRSITNSILGITGTNGKTTVTLLVTHVLNHCGIACRALGNVGHPLTREIAKNLTSLDTFVLELSSYQLETMQQKVFDSGLLLNITPDHLDRYRDIEHYAFAKSQLAKCLKVNKTLFIEYETWQTFSKLFEEVNVKTYGYTPHSIIYTDLKNVYFHGDLAFCLPINLQGKRSHEVENLMGAYALCLDKGISGSDFINAFATFKKPPHRIQFIDQIQGVYYFDDSKGTNIDAVKRAVQSLPGPIILIAGGVHKGIDYISWKKEFKGKVKKIIAIGQAARKIQEDLQDDIGVDITDSLENAVYEAAQIAKKGDYVLLSPGCASQDMFRDYAHRGEVFQQTVQSLVNKEK